MPDGEFDADAIAIKQYEIWVDAEKVSVLHNWKSAVNEFNYLTMVYGDKIVRLIAK